MSESRKAQATESRKVVSSPLEQRVYTELELVLLSCNMCGSDLDPTRAYDLHVRWTLYAESGTYQAWLKVDELCKRCTRYALKHQFSVSTIVEDQTPRELYVAAQQQYLRLLYTSMAGYSL